MSILYADENGYGKISVVCRWDSKKINHKYNKLINEEEETSEAGIEQSGPILQIQSAGGVNLQ